MLSDHDDIDLSKSNNSNVDGIYVWRAHRTSLQLSIYFLSKPRILTVVRLGFKDNPLHQWIQSTEYIVFIVCNQIPGSLLKTVLFIEH